MDSVPRWREAVDPVPGADDGEVRAGDREWPSVEAAEPPGPAGEHDHAGERVGVEHDMPERVVVARSIDVEVAVQDTGAEIGRRGVDHPHAALDRGDVRSS